MELFCESAGEDGQRRAIIWVEGPSFHLAMPGFGVEEIEPWRQDDELWRGLHITCPPNIASHSREQDFYFGPDFLLRRHDYHVEASGGFAAAPLPELRGAYMRGGNLHDTV